MIDPHEQDIGRAVIYTDKSSLTGQIFKIETGIITSYNSDYVFVRYGSGQTSAATRREDLEYDTGKELK